MKKMISSVLLIIMTLNIFIFNVSANTEFNETNLPTEDCEFGFIFKTDGNKYNNTLPDEYEGVSEIWDELNIYYAKSKETLFYISDKFRILSWEENYQINEPEEPEIDINNIINDSISLFSTDEEAVSEDIDNNSNSDELSVNDPWFEWQWYYEAVHADAYRNNGIDGTGVKIGIIDTGFNSDFDDFNYDNIHVINVPAIMNNDKSRMNYYDDDANGASADSGHGVPVTSIIAAQTNNGIGIAGITDNVEVIVFKVEDDGREIGTTGIAL